MSEEGAGLAQDLSGCGLSDLPKFSMDAPIHASPSTTALIARESEMSEIIVANPNGRIAMPPAYLKVHTASCHFLGNGKIRRFGCSLRFSGVGNRTHLGSLRPCVEFKGLGRLFLGFLKT